VSTTHPDDDERLLGALAHASIIANIVSMAGIVATTVLWVTQRERSRFVRAHALQALAFQAVVLLALAVMLLAWGACLALSLLPAALRPDLYAEGGPPAAFWVVLVLLVVPLGFAVATTLYGLYGAYRVFRGQPFRYPLVGRVVRRELAALYPPPRTPAPPPPVMPPPVPPSEAPASVGPSSPTVEPPAASVPPETPPEAAPVATSPSTAHPADERADRQGD
jgi:uncharacterized protein